MSKGKKIKRSIAKGIIHIQASYNNTIVTVCDEEGDVLTWATTGMCGFKGARKSTPYAAQVTAEKAIELSKSYGFEEAEIRVKGIGPGREQAIRGVYAAGIDIKKIVDVTPMPHNGCRGSNVRRV